MSKNNENIDSHDSLMSSDVQLLNVTVNESEKFAPLGNLTNKEFDLIKSETGWLDDTVSSDSGISVKAEAKF
eukprot:gene17181-18910_t